ncbi:MAG: SDR family oxidoreductase [Clostridia bacterium]|nr:SDR family oxidoreductase [Clostridia bacterium]
MGIKNKIAVITGAGGVLCSSFAKCLAKEGAAVMLLDINKESAELVAKEIIAEGGIAEAFGCNVLDKNSIKSVHNEILEKYGKVNILINGAGGNNPRATLSKEYYEEGDENIEDIKTFFNLEKEDFSFVFDLNLMGTLLPSQEFSRDMLGCDGVIINVSSMNAFKPLTKIPAYSSAKSAVSNFTEWLSVYFAESKIRVNAIAPGFFVTKQNKDLLFDKEGNPTPRTEKILRSTPMGRFGKPEELNGTLLFLADNEKSSFVTGVIIPVDGGFNAYSGV